MNQRLLNMRTKIANFLIMSANYICPYRKRNVELFKHAEEVRKEKLKCQNRKKRKKN